MNGFDLVARCLQAEGVTWMACFPANPLIEAAAKIGIRPIVFRQERGGINAIDGYSRQTAGQQIGVFASQSGPGVENSFGAIAQAWGDSVPILFLPGGSGTGGGHGNQLLHKYSNLFPHYPFAGPWTGEMIGHNVAFHEHKTTMQLAANYAQFVAIRCEFCDKHQVIQIDTEQIPQMRIRARPKI